MNPPKNLGQSEVTFLSSALSTGGGASVPPSYLTTERTRRIAAQFAKKSYVVEDEGRCGYCGAGLKWDLTVDLDEERKWHLGCVEREIDRREQEL